MTSFEPHSITIYVNTDRVGWSSVNFWSWGGDGSHAPVNNTWPGDRVTTKTTIDGREWFAKTFTINNPDDYVNFVFSTGSGSPQTVDIENISTDTFFEISTEQKSGKNLVNNVTSVENITIDPSDKGKTGIFDLQGRKIPSVGPLSKGVYIVNGKKIVIK